MKPTRLNRTLDYYRHHRNRVIDRKLKLTKQLDKYVKQNQKGRLAKAKLHCSCWMCSQKTGRAGYTKSDKTKIAEQLK